MSLFQIIGVSVGEASLPGACSPYSDTLLEIDLDAELGIAGHQDLRGLEPAAVVRGVQCLHVATIENVEHVKATGETGSTKLHSLRGAEVDLLLIRQVLRTGYDERD